MPTLIASVTCRSCGREIRLRRLPQLGLRLVCPGCGTKLEVIGLVPLEVDWAFDQPLGEAASEILVEDSGGEGDPAGASA
jgi:lysine biosynthesis protein LysW